MKDGSVLYLSLTGLLEGLGQAQVVEPVVRLACSGVRYEVMSLEREGDLAGASARQQVEERLRQAGVAWHPLPYRAGSVRGAARNLGGLAWTVSERLRGGGVSLIHARGYQAAAVALAAGRARRVPYLFDARGYWFDERSESGHILGRPGPKGMAKRFERALYQGASGVVTLTELSANDVRGGMFGAWDSTKPVEVITTCADYDQFRVEETRRNPVELGWSADAVVFGFVGSLNASYDAEATARAFRLIHDKMPSARLLAITRQRPALELLLKRAGVGPELYQIHSASHAEMVSWLARMHWGFLVLNPSFAKRASMPTKLGEFFASGVRPLVRACNDEVEDWVRRAGSGVILADTTEASLERASAEVAAAMLDPHITEAARERTRAHFSWETGVERYRSLIAAIQRAP